jgi:hypothetical protein
MAPQQLAHAAQNPMKNGVVASVLSRIALSHVHTVYFVPGARIAFETDGTTVSLSAIRLAQQYIYGEH